MSPLIQTINNWGQVFCHHALWMLVQTGVLVAILWMLDAVLRKHVKASLRYCIWLLVLVKLVLPVNLSLPSGIGYWLHFQSQQPVRSVETIMSKLPENAAPAKETVNTAAAVIPKIANTIGPETTVDKTKISYQQKSSTILISAQGWIFVLWLCVIVILAGGFVWQIVTVSRIIARSKPAPKFLMDILEHSMSVFRITKTVQLRLSDEISSPAVCGLLQPVIMIPSTLIPQLDKEQFETVLLHEFSHIQRGDLWLNTIQTLFQIFYFYNPFVRMANHFIRKTREQANDERVLVQLNGRLDCYGATLVQVAAAVIGRPAFAVRLIGVAEPKSYLHERITLMKRKSIPKTTKLGWTGGLVIVLLACVLLPMSQGKVMQSTATEVTNEKNQPVLNEIEKMDAELIQSFNDGNVNRLVSMFAEDGICLPNTLEPAIGREALTQYYLKTFRENAGVQILDVQHDNREFWLAGDIIFALDQYRIMIKTPSMRQVLTDYKKSLFVVERQPDGSLKMKAVADSLNPVPSDPRQYQAGKGSKEPRIVFHTVDTGNISTEQMVKNIEAVKALDIEFHKCFNRHDVNGALGYYADGAALLPLGKEPVRGIKALSTYIEEGMKEAELINNNQQIIDAGGTDKMIYIINKFNWQFRNPDNLQQIHSMLGKGIHVWQKQPDEEWKLLLDIYNVSVP